MSICAASYFATLGAAEVERDVSSITYGHVFYGRHVRTLDNLSHMHTSHLFLRLFALPILFELSIELRKFFDKLAYLRFRM